MKYILYIAAGLVFAYLIVPVFFVVPMSFSAGQYLFFPPQGYSLRWYTYIFHSSTWILGFEHSIIVAVSTTVIATVMGVMTAIGLMRVSARARSILFNFFMLPVVVPLIVMAVAFYKMYDDIGITGTVMSLVMAHIVICVPYVVATTLSALRSFDQNLEYAGLILGAGPLRTFIKVILPLILPGVISGAIFAFMTSFDEIIIASFVTNVNTQTLPVVMWNDIRLELKPDIAAVGSVIILFSIATLVSIVVYQILSSQRRWGGKGLSGTVAEANLEG